MTWYELAVTTIPEAAEAVAEVLASLGLPGVAVEDPGLFRRRAAEGRWDAYAFPPGWRERQDVTIRAYRPAPPPPAWQAELERRLAGLGGFFRGYSYRLEWREVEEEDWANAWRQHYHALAVGERIVVCPAWESYDPGPGRVVVRLDPGMAFGTGDHPTTLMVLQLLEENLRPGQAVLDVGTGSGVLAVAAALLGARRVLAVDNDPVAVRAAAENAALNGVAEVVEVRQGDGLQGVAGRFSLLLANITAGVLVALAPDLPRVLAPGGRALASGIIREREKEVAGAFARAGLLVRERRARGEWVALLAERG